MVSFNQILDPIISSSGYCELDEVGCETLLCQFVLCKQLDIELTDLIEGKVPMTPVCDYNQDTSFKQGDV